MFARQIELPESVDVWIMNMILQSVIQALYPGIFFDFDSDGGWSVSHINYFPIWTRDTQTRDKRAARLMIRYGSREFKMITNEMISDNDVLSIDEILEYLESCDARKVRPVSFPRLKKMIFEEEKVKLDHQRII